MSSKERRAFVVSLIIKILKKIIWIVSNIKSGELGLKDPKGAFGGEITNNYLFHMAPIKAFAMKAHL